MPSSTEAQTLALVTAKKRPALSRSVAVETSARPPSIGKRERQGRWVVSGRLERFIMAVIERDAGGKVCA
jgi:hypothetical protein